MEKAKEKPLSYKESLDEYRRIISVAEEVMVPHVQKVVGHESVRTWIRLKTKGKPYYLSTLQVDYDDDGIRISVRLDILDSYEPDAKILKSLDRVFSMKF
ncbi:MAG: hypothetical protein AAF378_18205 [Cyanobacteria bacterium P01_A01_bin.84]